MQGKYKLIGIIIPFLAIFLMSHNVGAVDLSADVRLVRTNNNLTFESNNFNSSLCHANATGGYWSSGACVLNSNFIYGVHNEYLQGDVLEIDIYLVMNQVNNSLDASLYNFFPSSNSPFELIAVEFENADTSLGVAKYYLRAKNYTSMSSGGFVSFDGSVYLFENEIIYAKSSTWRFVSDGTSQITGAVDDVVEAIQEAQEQNQEYQEQEQQAISNIENQTASGMSQSGSTENAQTSSLLQTVGGLLTALQSMQTGSCTVQLPLPNFAGGSMTVNICQGKDKTGNLVSIFGSVALIVFYIPLAWKLISMIYSEIRSFTNG